MTFGISSEYRRRGLAGLLLKRLKEVITANYPTAKTMGLHVQASNEAAFSFYRRAGFRVQSFERDYYTFSEKTPVLPGQSKCRDAYAMSCRLAHGAEGSEQQGWWKSCSSCCCCWDWGCLCNFWNKALQSLRSVISLGGQDKRME